ncbi:MAG: chorismate mutase [Gammaproteobacteria bacterium]|nr:chorismate mutase [Gammaproteobacteria bacterium]
MLSSEQLNALREQIDHIDLELIKLLAERQQLCDQVGQHKISAGLETRDLEREKDIIAKKIALGQQSGLSAQYVQQVFQLLIEQSVKRQYQMRVPPTGELSPRVAFLGEHGSYSHQALNQYYSNSQVTAKPFGYPSFSAIVEAVIKGEMDIGILPIENTTSGAILEVYDLLQGAGIHIIGEDILSIEHCLLGHAENLGQIEKVYGHPQALTQCSNLLSQHPSWSVEYCPSSANAIEKVIKNKQPGEVAIANDFASQMYQLPVVMRNISNNKRNFTRFLIIAKDALSFPETIPCKVSLVLATRQTAGSLACVLNEFKSRDIALSKLQSRPIPEKPWEELFYLDLEGHVDSPNVQAAIENCENLCQFLKVLGCYPSAKLAEAV